MVHNVQVRMSGTGVGPEAQIRRQTWPPLLALDHLKSLLLKMGTQIKCEYFNFETNSAKWLRVGKKSFSGINLFLALFIFKMSSLVKDSGSRQNGANLQITSQFRG